MPLLLSVLVLMISLPILGILTLNNIHEESSKMIDSITVPFVNVKSTPDPTKVVTTWEWYFLDQVSSSMIKWDADENSFVPVLAEKWHIDNEEIHFTLKSNLLFSDGTPITSSDVRASVMRVLINKSNSHFKPWELLTNCENVQNFSDPCEGIKIHGPLEISFKLKYPSESFFLFMACPEGGIWKSSELENTPFLPKVFSGPYQVEPPNGKYNVLKKNENWALHKKFPNRPTFIKAPSPSDSEFKENLGNDIYDIVLDLERPFIDLKLHDNFFSKRTAFNTLYYLFRVSGSKHDLNRSSLKKLWQKEFPEFIAPAETFLPFSGLSGVGKEQILNLLPESENKVRVGYLETYFSSEFISFLFSNSDTVPISLNKFEYFESFKKDFKNKMNLDFVLSPYVASERYPSVQINFLMEDREIPFDISDLDHRDKVLAKKRSLEAVQTWMIQTQQIIPLVFGRSKLFYNKKIRIGKQPLVDSEVQLWRINE